jgi:hypothetical protein
VTENKTLGVKWELVFLSPYSGCTNYQYQMANTYDEITSKYFELYKFDNSNYPPQCMSDKKYSSYKVPGDLNLLILVYDNEIGKKELRTNQVNGLYNHVGPDRSSDHTIIICDCSNFGYSDPVWALSHELSHFITYYLGFDLSVVETRIHSIEAKYTTCIDGLRNETCSNVAAKIYGDRYFTFALVMPPYAPAIGKKLIPASDNQTASGSINQSDVASLVTSPVVMNMQKEITKWWLAGQINDTEYTKVLSYMTDKSEGGILTTDRLPNNVILLDSANGKTGNHTFYNSISGISKIDSSILKRVPFKLENITNGISNKVPQWFKTKAQSWAQNQTLNNDAFVTGVKFLFSNGTLLNSRVGTNDVIVAYGNQSNVDWKSLVSDKPDNNNMTKSTISKANEITPSSVNSLNRACHEAESKVFNLPVRGLSSNGHFSIPETGLPPVCLQ